MPPQFKAGQTESKIQVPAIAANSKVGFKETMASVDEGKCYHSNQSIFLRIIESVA